MTKNIKHITSGIFLSVAVIIPLLVMYLFEKDRQNIIRIIVEGIIEINSIISAILLFFSKFTFDNLTSHLKKILIYVA